MSKYTMSDDEMKKLLKRRKEIAKELNMFSLALNTFVARGAKEVITSAFVYGVAIGLQKKDRSKNGK